MKHLTKLTTVLMLLLMGFSFTACSDDDDENGDASNIVGSWKYTYDDGDYEIMTFNADGTGSNTEYYGSTSATGVYYFTYVFNAKEQTLTLDWHDDDEIDGPFGPVFISGNKLYIEGDEYVRVK